MPIGKDSIQKRVAKVDTQDNIAPELVATTAAAPAKTSTPKKTTTKSTTTKSTTAKPATTAKKPAAKKPAAPKAEEVKVETAVLTNVSPETVEKVIGHKEDEKYEKVQIGQKMPTFLM